MATLDEVARRAGVTAATVSNVLRERGRVGEATRARVLEAVEALGYRPHLAARALAEGRAPTVALMVSSIANPLPGVRAGGRARGAPQRAVPDRLQYE